MVENNIASFISKVTRHKTVGVFSHLRPDGDAIGSQMAFCRWLSARGVQVKAFNEDPVPANLAWMLPFFPIVKPTLESVTACEAYVFLDGNGLNRFGSLAEGTAHAKRPFYLIDHHPSSEMPFEAAIHDVSASSTAELVFYLYLNSDLGLLDKESAKAIYTGIMTDTGSFRFDSVRFTTHTIVSELVRIGGFNVAEIHEAVYDDKTAGQIALLGKALQTVALHGDGFASMYVTKAMLDETGCSKQHTEGFTQYPLSVQGVHAIVFCVDFGDRIKASFRTKRDIDANLWARQWKGGGHVRASGGWHDGPMEKAIIDFIASGKALLKETTV
jgi:phosphoesterase RecJ-like protein